MEKTFSKLCTPAKIYFAIAVVASVFALFRGITFGVVFMKMVFAFIWTYILAWLCSKGYSSISWFLVLFPYIVILLALLRIAYIYQHKPIFRSVGLQGAYGQEAMSGMPEDDEEDKEKDFV
jgi:Na+/H+ antiporter NhaB